MTKFKTTLLLTLFCACTFSACKKDNPRDKFIGTFNALGACQPNPYQIVVEPSTVGDNYVNIKNMYADSAVVLGLLGSDVYIAVNTQIVGSNTYNGNLNFNDEAKTTGTFYCIKNGVACGGVTTRVQ
jgi:hypothetical protein